MFLIVEDNPITAMLMRDVIDNMGLSDVCHGASSAEEALLLANNYNYGLILLDLGLPGKSGFWFAINVRHLEEPYRSVPIVVVTGGIAAEDSELWDQCGFATALAKPFGVEELTRTITAYRRN